MKKYFFLFILALVTSGCGKHPADLLRVGQAPLYNFPMYVSSSDGSIYKFNKDASQEVFVTGLNDPRGLAIDKYQNMYIAEYGASRVVKYNLSTKVATVVASSLLEPTAVAVDSFGDVYVTQEGPAALNVMRIKDQKIIQTYTSGPSAIAFGVNDILLVGLYDAAKVLWGGTANSPSDSILEPVMITTDANGRTYIAEGTATNAKVYRYHQSEPSGKTVVADNLSGATGIAVDAVGNIYIAEPGASRISLVTFKNEFFFWTSVNQPQQMAFTPY